MEKWGRRADRIHAAALASHIACCGAPIALNMLALAFGAGLFAAASPWITATHDFVHGREVWFIGFSAMILVAAGAFQYLSWREDCGSSGCGHGSCAPKKMRRLRVFGLVCALFLVNLSLFAWHQTAPFAAQSAHDGSHAVTQFEAPGRAVV